MDAGDTVRLKASSGSPPPAECAPPPSACPANEETRHPFMSRHSTPHILLQPRPRVWSPLNYAAQSTELEQMNEYVNI